MVITSLQNTTVKAVVQLSNKASARKASGKFVVEGMREVQQCIGAGYKVETLFLCRDMLSVPLPSDILSQTQVVEVSAAVYRKMAYRESTEGVIAVVENKEIHLEDLAHEDNPLYVVLESVEKPGNLGAILRSADAAHVSAVIVCDAHHDFGNPNLIRSSLGARFTVPLVGCTSEECIQFLKNRGVQILTAQLQDSHLYYTTDMVKPTAIVMGTESTGLTDVWRAAADAHIRIPMLGNLDSLNVSVSTAILLFEAVRQRHLSGDIRFK
ncbi:MAG: RNA methyltransferase [Bacteroidaceae bacterium]|nr:RNA methyltransferase [Bacteroidaceae bacterium]